MLLTVCENYDDDDSAAEVNDADDYCDEAIEWPEIKSANIKKQYKE